MAAKFVKYSNSKSMLRKHRALFHHFLRFLHVSSSLRKEETNIKISDFLLAHGVSIKTGSNLDNWVMSQERSISTCDVPAVKLRLDYLTSLGIKKEDLVKPLNERPWVLRHDMTQMNRNVSFLESLGIRGDSLARVVVCKPQVLSLQVNTLEQRVKHLKNSGFSDANVLRLILRHPSSLTSCLESIVPTKMQFLQETIGLDKEETIILMCKRPYLMGMKLEKIATRIQFLKSTVGLNHDQLKKGILKGPGPALLTLNEESMKAKLDYYQKVMGLSSEVIKKQPALLTFSQAKIIVRHQFLIHVGFAKTRWSSFLSLIIRNDERFIKRVSQNHNLAEYNSFKSKVLLDMKSYQMN